MSFVKKNLIDHLANFYYPNFLRKDLEKTLNLVFNEIIIALQKGSSVQIRQFGTFTPKIQRSRAFRNPRTGKNLSLPTKQKIKVHFKPSKKLKLFINKKDNNE